MGFTVGVHYLPRSTIQRAYLSDCTAGYECAREESRRVLGNTKLSVFTDVLINGEKVGRNRSVDDKSRSGLPATIRFVHSTA